jgi:hypothetical protein
MVRFAKEKNTCDGHDRSAAGLDWRRKAAVALPSEPLIRMILRD